MPRDDRIARAMALIAALEPATLSLKQLVDRIELISSSPQETRAILDAATRRGLIARDGSQIAIRDRSVAPALTPAVIRRAGSYRCRRCGRRLSEGHFIQLPDGEVGPFGATCVDRVLSGPP
jgi:hypothetical protein